MTYEPRPWYKLKPKEPRKPAITQSEFYQRKRNAFLELYGNVCACCGETRREFLTIEHVNGQRGKKRETSAVAYGKALKEFRPDLYQILCMNCNHAKGKYGYCPHERDA